MSIWSSNKEVLLHIQDRVQDHVQAGDRSVNIIGSVNFFNSCKTWEPVCYTGRNFVVLGRLCYINLRGAFILKEMKFRKKSREKVRC